MAGMHVHATVQRRDGGGTDWNGRKIVRLDLRDGNGRDVHVYVPSSHPLAALAVGGKLRLVSDG